MFIVSMKTEAYKEGLEERKGQKWLILSLLALVLVYFVVKPKFPEVVES